MTSPSTVFQADSHDRVSQIMVVKGDPTDVATCLCLFWAYQWRLRLLLSSDGTRFKDVPLPFLPGHRLHSYGYDLKLLGCNCYSRIYGIEIAPARAGRLTTDDGFTVESVRFARK